MAGERQNKTSCRCSRVVNNKIFRGFVWRILLISFHVAKGEHSPRFLSRASSSTCRPKSRRFAGEARESCQSGVCFDRLLWRSEVSISKIVFNVRFGTRMRMYGVLRRTIAEKLLLFTRHEKLSQVMQGFRLWGRKNEGCRSECEL